MEPPIIPKMPKIRDYYSDLCIQQSATAQDIRRAHRVLAIKHHPDKQPPGAKADTEKFRIIQEAYENLRDASKRSRYDTYYENLKEKWRAYEEWQNKECERERQEKAEEEERQRQSGEAEQARRQEETKRESGLSISGELSRRKKENEENESMRLSVKNRKIFRERKGKRERG
ncbi:DnaJ domain-containing protein [Colletotrichum godetiae]|uniref:DnaJ domain-containing protein n=1 Tax=Colletotrichum godetiae TaxID=1209918 RepID=A0AAJ0AWH9_9PEZI|nr:DnaJ domain-containing protein [Colletotrichum godetiae]KAK1689419.1 DnaJ domain-containing protein [Colletotrichum godetiae]